MNKFVVIWVYFGWRQVNTWRGCWNINCQFCELQRKWDLHFNAKETYIQQKRDQHTTQKRRIFIFNTQRDQFSAQQRPMSTNMHTHTLSSSWADKRDLYPLIRTHAPYYYKCTHTLYYYHARTHSMIIRAHTLSVIIMGYGEHNAMSWLYSKKKKTYDFKEPTNRSHPITSGSSWDDDCP